MDVPTANQSQTPCYQWAGQNGWSTASSPGPLCNPLPGVQHLSLGSPSDHRPGYQHLQASNQGCLSNLNTFSSSDSSYHSTPCANNAEQNSSVFSSGTVKEFVPSTAAQGRNNIPQSPNSESRYGLDPELLPSARPLPVCKESECVVGCGWCGASMCPAMSWQDCGQRFYCPFCGKLSEVPWQHYQPTKGVEGVQVDRDKRPELSLGEDGGASDVRIGLITYDRRIHLYNLSPALSRPHMLVITETEDLQLPVREGLLVSIKDCIDSIDSAECNDSSGVPMELPVKAGVAVLQALGCPGKLLIFHTAALIETGHSNSSSGFFGSNKPKPSEQAVSLAKECVRQGCGVHLFVLSQQDVGGAWPGHIPYLTGGALHTYNHLQGELDRERFITDLKRTVDVDTGYKAELRIFVSKDLRVSGCYGLFVPGPSPGHVAMATLDWWTTLAVELAHTRALDETRGVAIQHAVRGQEVQGSHSDPAMLTSAPGCFPPLPGPNTAHFLLQEDVLCSVGAPSTGAEGGTADRDNRSIDVLPQNCCSASVSAGQLVLPQYLRALPVYINSLRKSEVLLPGLRSSIHQRLQQHCQVLSMDTCSTATHFYPLLLPLPLSAENADPPNPEEALRCSAASLEPRALYLIHAPLTLLLWVGTQVPASTLVELFNTSCFSSLPSGETKLPVLENPLSISIRSLINTLNSQVPCARKLWVVKQGDTCEEALQRHLVEDKSPNGGASYADFLYHLHRVQGVLERFGFSTVRSLVQDEVFLHGPLCFCRERCHIRLCLFYT
ncbi:hypothetical protein INR49_000840 [Caranx melampygus]|nr:hypothetical protein INR49_000840 [Caranx melampygus]